MNKVTIKDLLDYKLINNIKVVNHQLFGTLKTMDEKSNSYFNNIVRYDEKKKEFVPFTSDNKIGSFTVEEDDLIFAASRSKEDEAKEDEEKSVYYRLSTCGGEAQKAYSFELNVDSFKKINDELFAVITTEGIYKNTELSKEEKEEEKDYIVLHEVPFVANGAGFIDGNRSHLYLYDIKTNKKELLTDKTFDTANVEVLGNKIFYTGYCWEDINEGREGLFCYDITTKETEVIVPYGKLHISRFKVDELGIYFMATDLIPYEHDTSCDFYYYDFKTKKAVKLLDYSYSLGNMSSSDVASRAESFILKDHQLYFISTVGHHGQLYTLVNNTIKKVFDFNGAVCGFTFDEDKIYFIGMEPEMLPEVYCFEKEIDKLTDYSKVLDNKAVQKVEYAGFTNRLGMKIDGWIIKPVGYEEEKKYPAILDIHGGPRSAYSDLFFHEMQVWASEGYFVFFCNPQGSDGYGDAFADMREKYGTIDYDDFMDFTDFILASYPDIDEKRVGVTGGSYGGYMTNWIITHTNRFKAAATQRSISDWVSDYGTSGISYNDPLHGHAKPWDDMEKMWRSSPLQFANNCTTPTLFIHSFEDYTCAISQAYELFTALKMLGVETRACLFKGENHGLSRNGKPKHRFRRLKEITDWMNSHLK